MCIRDSDRRGLSRRVGRTRDGLSLVGPALHRADPSLGGAGRLETLAVRSTPLQVIADGTEDGQPAGDAIVGKFLNGQDIADQAVVEPAPNNAHAPVTTLERGLSGWTAQRGPDGQETRPLRRGRRIL